LLPKYFVLFEAAKKIPRWPTIFTDKPFRIMEAVEMAKKKYHSVSLSPVCAHPHKSTTEV